MMTIQVSQLLRDAGMAPEYDGHSSEDALQRIRSLAYGK